MKKLLQKTLFMVTITSVWLLGGTTAFAATETATKPTEIIHSEDCPFCDGHELTVKEKCEELIVKALTDEDNLLADGFITKEVYLLQCEPFEKALDRLEVASEQETLEIYKWILWCHFDEVCEEEADGEVIDEEFLDYIIQEIEKYNTELFEEIQEEQSLTLCSSSLLKF